MRLETSQLWHVLAVVCLQTLNLGQKLRVNTLGVVEGHTDTKSVALEARPQLQRLVRVVVDPLAEGLPQADEGGSGSSDEHQTGVDQEEVGEVDDSAGCFGADVEDTAQHDLLPVMVNLAGRRGGEALDGGRHELTTEALGDKDDAESDALDVGQVTIHVGKLLFGCLRGGENAVDLRLGDLRNVVVHASLVVREHKLDLGQELLGEEVLGRQHLLGGLLLVMLGHLSALDQLGRLSGEKEKKKIMQNISKTL